MKILVLSDSHGNISAIERAIGTDAYDAVIFCGDGIDDISRAELRHQNICFHSVKGNCDVFSDRLTDITPVLCGKRFFVTHGHKYSAKRDESIMIMHALSEGASFLLYGHTHCSDCHTDSGIYVMNPGSIGYNGTYGVIDISNEVSLKIGKI